MVNITIWADATLWPIKRLTIFIIDKNHYNFVEFFINNKVALPFVKGGAKEELLMSMQPEWGIMNELEMGGRLAVSADFATDCLHMLKTKLPFDAGFFIRTNAEKHIEISAEIGFLPGMESVLPALPMSLIQSPDYVDKATIFSKDDKPCRYQKFFSEYGFEECLAITVNPAGDGIRIFRRAKSGHFDRYELDNAKSIARWLGTADKRNAEYRETVKSAKMLKTLSARLYFGVVILNDDFDFISANPIALQRMHAISGDDNTKAAKFKLSSIIKEIVESDKRASPHIDFFRVVNNYVIEVMKCSDVTAGGDLHTFYLVLIFDLSWFAGIKSSLTENMINEYKYTPREQQTVTLFLEGCSTAQIAEKMCISPLTVKEHLKRIMHKTGVKSRNELIIKLYSDGFMPVNFDNQ